MLDITSPLFTTAELCRVAGLAPPLAKVWLQRGLLRPGRADLVAVRKRPLFSVMSVFQARLARELGKGLEMGPLDAGEAGRAKKQATQAVIRHVATSAGEAAEPVSRLLAEGKRGQKSGKKSLVNIVTDEGWTWAVARSVERGKPLPLLGGVAKHDGCWSFYIALDPMELAKNLGPADTYAVIPIGAMFAHVYLDCKAIYERTTGTCKDSGDA